MRKKRKLTGDLRPRGAVHSLLAALTRSPRRPCASHLAALPSSRAIETRLLPSSLGATHRALEDLD